MIRKGASWGHCIPIDNWIIKTRQVPITHVSPWWRHQMEIFSTLLALCAGNSPVTGEFPAQRPVTRSFDVFSDLHPNKRLSKQSSGWWFETPSRSLWRHCNDDMGPKTVITVAADGQASNDQNHRPHSRQVTGARCTGGRGSPVMSWILLKANNAQQASGVGDKRFFRFMRNVQHLWTAIIRHPVNDITHQQVMRFNQWSKFANIF